MKSAKKKAAKKPAKSAAKRGPKGALPQHLPQNLRDLWEAAAEARQNSYSPYSGHKVGAAIRTRDGRIIAGCNVENASYGGTVCAERGAIQSAVARHGKFELADVLVVTDANPPWPPCGLCRQVIAEFGAADTLIHACGTGGQVRTTTFGELTPDAFTPGHLKKR